MAKRLPHELQRYVTAEFTPLRLGEEEAQDGYGANDWAEHWKGIRRFQAGS